MNPPPLHPSPPVTAPSWFSAAPSNRALMANVAQAWADSSTSEQYLQSALSQPQVELDVLVGAYRYYFYKHQDAKALEIATTVTNASYKLNSGQKTGIASNPSC
ncbi:MAG: hypothetical protein AAF635_16170 [Cyanobacteria bacterium P01_C01_bin.69]